jgi:inorganic pyrophosphatase/exopolyphosphatase
LLQAGTGLSSRPPDEIVKGDLKTYTAGGFKFGIAQAEVSDLYELDKYLDPLRVIEVTWKAKVRFCRSDDHRSGGHVY